MQSPIQQYLDSVHERLFDVHGGEQPQNNPSLAEADPDLCGLAMTTADGYTYTSGDAEVPFSMQSISKVFCYAIALQDRGFRFMDAKIDVEPSGSSFKDLSSEANTGRPKNPLINIGAIAATAQILPDSDGEVFDKILRVMSDCAARDLEVDEVSYEADRDGGMHNRALSWFLASWGIIDGDPLPAFDDYSRQCAILTSAKDLSIMSATLTNLGVNPVTGKRVFSRQVAQRVLSVMLTCGMYDDSGDWVSSVGMPAKSGVGGGIISALPGQLGIATYAPPLDQHGSSVRGLAAHRILSRDLELHFVRTSKAGLSTIRTHDTIDHVPSTTRRPEAAEAVLAEYGERAHVLEVMGDLLFSGIEVLSREVATFDKNTVCVVVDLSRADHIAEVSVKAISRLAAALADVDTSLGLVDPFDRLANLLVPVDMQVEIFEDRNDALSWAEDQILRQYGDEDCFPDEAISTPVLLEGIDEKIREKVVSLLKREEYDTGDIVRKVGDEFDGIRFIVSGEVHTLNPEDEGGDVNAQLVAGMSFGELALNETYHQPFDVRVAEPTVVELLSKSAIEKLEKSDPEAAAMLWRAIAVEGYIRLGQVMRGVN